MGKNEKPEEGDKVSWNWGGGAPGGTVTETKENGAIEMKTQRGNTIKKKADPSNPAVRIERLGNDVVKRSSELTVEEKNNKGGKAGSKRKAKDQDPEADEVEDGDEQEDEEEKDDDEGPHTENKQGKEVKKGGKEANKKQKREQNGKAEEQNEDNEIDGATEDDDQSAEEAKQPGEEGDVDNDDADYENEDVDRIQGEDSGDDDIEEVDGSNVN
ncbi:hypothetical protein F4776DRAFT_637072 [Hypoxylon sp. NC0597]|nr:hypothetical protein F4776DRAFT_637072 [Hypoxylon sp. NC0597]